MSNQIFMNKKSQMIVANVATQNLRVDFQLVTIDF
jgi:hypothetical protein